MGWRGLIFAVVFSVAMGAALAWFIERPGLTRGTTAPVVSQGEASLGGAFSLVDHTGQPVTDANYRGRYLLVYFGFTYCPDVCPAELQTIATALDRLGKRAARVQPLFITVDPERDTTDVLAQYVRHFSPTLVGLTGTAEQVAAAARAYRVFYAKDRPPEPGAPYTVNHSSYIYLMDPAGRFLDHFVFGTQPEEIARKIERHL